jgi:UDP-N-acetylmuramate dehydrogenase
MRCKMDGISNDGMAKEMLEIDLVQENIALAPLTTLGVGGAARYFAEIRAEHELPMALAFAQQRGLTVLLLGGGSNLVVADEGFDGLVVHMALRGLEARVEGNLAWVTVMAGEEWDAIVAHCVAQNWAGVECLSGIPGSVGGTPVQNVGAYGQEVSETITAVRVYDRLAGEVIELSNAKCQFSYRRSLFNTTARERYVVLGVTYSLRANGELALHYADLQQHFAALSSRPTLAAVREAVLAIRRRKAMVIDPHDPDTRSAGSFFKNPIISPEQFVALETNARRIGLVKADEKIPRYAAAGGQVKVPAAWLIERAGFAKGYTRGRVGLSNKHTLALVNRGNASASEVVELMREIQGRVQERFDVWLTPEPVFVGFDELG